MIGPVEHYTADQIQVLTFEEHVRSRPAMYFRVDRGSPELPTEVLQRVVWDALHHSDGTHGQIIVETGSDLGFTVEDDQRPAADEQGRPLPGLCGSLLGKERWAPAAAAALSVRAVVEVRLDGRGYRQELVGTKGMGAWEEFATSEPSGTRATFPLDPSYCGPDEAIAWSLLPEGLHGQECDAHPSPVTFPIQDVRAGADNSVGE
jgi:DNA gyrase/topoisomerase IV subunit B